MSIDATAGDDPMRQQRVATITCYKCCQRGHYRNDCPNSPGTNPVPHQNLTYNPILLWHRWLQLLCCLSIQFSDNLKEVTRNKAHHLTIMKEYSATANKNKLLPCPTSSE